MLSKELISNTIGMVVGQFNNAEVERVINKLCKSHLEAYQEIDKLKGLLHQAYLAGCGDGNVGGSWDGYDHFKRLNDL